MRGVGADRARSRRTTSRAFRFDLARGDHVLSIGAGDAPASVTSADRGSESRNALAREARAALPIARHRSRAKQPLQPRKAARQVLASFLPRRLPPAGRTGRDRPLHGALRSCRPARRSLHGSMKLALRGVLVLPDFLFRIEQRNPAPGIHPLGQYELADAAVVLPLVHRAGRSIDAPGRTGSAAGSRVLKAQVERMLDDPALAHLRRHLRRTMAGHAGSGRPRRAAAHRTTVLLHARCRGRPAHGADPAVRSHSGREPQPARTARLPIIPF